MDDRRLRCLVLAFAGAGCLLAGRLIQLQIIDGPELAERAARQRLYVETIPARPGEIVDRNGRLLAVTIQTPSLYVVPNRIRDPETLAARLATILDLDADRLTAALKRNRDKSFLWVRRRLSDDQAAAIDALDLPAGQWGFRDEYLRRYPQGSLAAHLLGLRDIDNVGNGGIEARFDAALRGRDGRRVILRDARGRAIEIRDEVSTLPTPGRTIVLSIDSVIQFFAEQSLDDLMVQHAPRGACAIVVDVESSQVLAIANRPTFDPNDPGRIADDAWTNRAVTAVYEPGSTFKPLVVAWAIDAGVLKPDERIDCEGGAYHMGRRILHDHHPYGELSVTDVLVKSSNIGMAKIGERLGIDRLYDCVTAFGFGQSTGIELPSEQRGVVRPPGQWNDYSLGSIPMGHELLVTPLQLIMAHAALANGGRLRNPQIVLRDVDPVLIDESADVTSNDAFSSAPVTSPVVRREAANWVIHGPMAEVIRRGTGKAAALEGYTVFGKTGTAQKFDTETGTFSHSRHVVSFIAGAPAENPRVLVLVMADEPSGPAWSGGQVAAPPAAEILHRTLQHLGVRSHAVEGLAVRPLQGDTTGSSRLD